MDNQHILTDDEIARRRRIQGTHMPVPQDVYVVVCGDDGEVDVFNNLDAAAHYAEFFDGTVYKRKIRG